MKKNKKKKNNIRYTENWNYCYYLCYVHMSTYCKWGNVCSHYNNARFREIKNGLAFWGSYLGGCISGICSLITIYVTIKYYDRQETEHKKELEDQLLKHENEIRGRGYKEISPVVNFTSLWRI